MQEVPSLEFKLLRSQRLNFKNVMQVASMLGMDAEAFLAQQALDWVENFTQSEQGKDFLTHKEPAVMKPIEFKKRSEWQVELIGLRYRGLPIEILDRIAAGTHGGDEFIKFLKKLGHIEPITSKAIS
jgi:hypothetical protein